MKQCSILYILLLLVIAHGTLAAQELPDQVIDTTPQTFEEHEEPKHFIVHLDTIPNREQRTIIERSGITLLSYFGDNSFYASSSNTLDKDIPHILAIRTIPPKDKLSPQLIDESSLIDNKEQIKISVQFFKDTSLQDNKILLERYEGTILSEIPQMNLLQAHISVANTLLLAQEDSVLWIEKIQGEFTPDNDKLRTAVNVDPVQLWALPPLLGEGERILQFDEDCVKQDHSDFKEGAIILLNSSCPPNSHATHVAGTIIGTGQNSKDGSGYPSQWRGIAPQARLFSATGNSWQDLDLMLQYYYAAINRGVRVSTNSWSLSFNDEGILIPTGIYTAISRFYEELVRGLAGAPITIVVSAGNYGRNQSESPFAFSPDGYRSAGYPNAAKNTINVGSLNTQDFARTRLSSMGPSRSTAPERGRIKPDLLAPGCHNNTHWELNAADASNEKSSAIWSVKLDEASPYYFGMCGTSSAAPAVSGGILLMQEWMKHTHNDVMLPSTIKGILIHTATDLHKSGDGSLAFDGPDYTTGWGAANIKKAIDHIDEHSIERPLFVQKQISDQAEEDTYTMHVAHNPTEISVTLVWADPPSLSGNSAQLINDLDLKLIDPYGNEYLPWLLDPLNYQEAAIRGIDTINNVEQVRILPRKNQNVNGEWTVKVQGTRIPQPTQKYSLIFSHPLNGPIRADPIQNQGLSSYDLYKIISIILVLLITFMIVIWPKEK